MRFSPSRRERLLRAGAVAGVLAVLAGVFMLYTRPGFLVTMIDRVWACF